MIEVTDPKYIDLIKELIPNEILSLNPVIAGGFMTAFYNECMKSDESYNNFLNKKEYMKIYSPFFGYENKTKPKISDGFISVKAVLGNKFSDIDLWFLNSNDQINKKLINLGNSVTDMSINEIFETDERMQHIYNGTHIKIAGLHAACSKISHWALTFNTNGSIFQIIRKKFESIDEIFSCFDIENCMIAYHNGAIYMHDNFQKLFNSSELSLNSKALEESSFAQKAFSVQRFWKYSTRYSLFPNDHSIEFMKNIYINELNEAIDLLKSESEKALGANQITTKQVYSKNIFSGLANPIVNGTPIIQPTSTHSQNPYGKKYANNISTLRSCIALLEQNFNNLVISKNFDKKHLVYMIGTKSTEISRTISNVLSNIKNESKE